ncbi:carboxypeptidase-like regulatory domain-containing protein [Bremerella sp. T1]|uniref:carboxypeptidase-like regulatory domain-containing protein n=1 Tax=Bremerella sp. TYQ1 TaxID=3119568 RepID=UPI001CCB267B|nr:carboxypeptidase-like regulatory domain-containing protein [Bremerella volcania]UBM34839.1 carboxypeptidase-like regulatory domain-containing protein [Bremerella volcania]
MTLSWSCSAPFAVCAALIVLAGCGGSESLPSLGATVSGTVTYKESPIEGAMVTFLPTGEGGQGAFARTDADGKYTLSSSAGGNNGVKPGTYHVTVSKIEVPQVQLAGEDDPNYNPYAKTNAKPNNALPEKYAQQATSGLEIEVTNGANDVPLNLTD